jgi:NADH dehydrogenase/NADH:ubiquinone oxidoreductase subunit G
MTTWKDAILSVRESLKGKKIAVLVGADMTQEEATLLLDLSKQKLGGAPVYQFGTQGVETAAADAAADALLKRKSKTANLHGLEKLGIAPFASLPAGTQAVLLVRGGRAQLPSLSGVQVYGLGVFTRDEAAKFECVLPGQAFAEKAGTIVNFQGVEQKFRRAVTPPRECKSLSETFMMWTNY